MKLKLILCITVLTLFTITSSRRRSEDAQAITELNQSLQQSLNGECDFHISEKVISGLKSIYEASQTYPFGDKVQELKTKFYAEVAPTYSKVKESLSAAKTKALSFFNTKVKTRFSQFKDYVSKKIAQFKSRKGDTSSALLDLVKDNRFTEFLAEKAKEHPEVISTVKTIAKCLSNGAKEKVDQVKTHLGLNRKNRILPLLLASPAILALFTDSTLGPYARTIAIMVLLGLGIILFVFGNIFSFLGFVPSVFIVIGSIVSLMAFKSKGERKLRELDINDPKKIVSAIFKTIKSAIKDLTSTLAEKFNGVDENYEFDPIYGGR